MQNFITNSNVVVTRDSIGLTPGQVRIPAAQYEEIVEITTAREDAQAIVEAAKATAAQVHQVAREEGFEAGKAAATKEALDQVVQMQNTMDNWVKHTDTQLIELVGRCVAEVVNKIDPTLLVATSVEKGLADLASSAQIVVRVHPECASVDGVIAEVVERHGITSTIKVVKDGSLSPADVVIESAAGVVDLRTQKQLAQIEKALSGK